MKRIFILFAVMVLVAIYGTATDRFYMEDFSIAPGETRSVSILLDNEAEYTAFQSSIYLPDGLSASNFVLTDRKHSSHIHSTSVLPDGGIQLLSYTVKLKPYTGNSGALVTMDITASEGFTGPATIAISNTLFTTMAGEEIPLDDEVCNVNGQGETPEEFTLTTTMAELSPDDTLQLQATGGEGITWSSSDETVASVDGNGLVTAIKSGMVAITATLPNGESQWCAIFIHLRGDTNHDNNVSIIDVTVLISYLLTNTWP